MRPNSQGKVPENLEIVQLLDDSTGNSGVKIKWNGNFQESLSENLGIRHEVDFFFGNYANSRFAIQR